MAQNAGKSNGMGEAFPLFFQIGGREARFFGGFPQKMEKEEDPKAFLCISASSYSASTARTWRPL